MGFYYLASKQCGLELFYWSPGMGLLYIACKQGSKAAKLGCVYKEAHLKKTKCCC